MFYFYLSPIQLRHCRALDRNAINFVIIEMINFFISFISFATMDTAIESDHAQNCELIIGLLVKKGAFVALHL